MVGSGELRQYWVITQLQAWIDLELGLHWQLHDHWSQLTALDTPSSAGSGNPATGQPTMTMSRYVDGDGYDEDDDIP